MRLSRALVGNGPRRDVIVAGLPLHFAPSPSMPGQHIDWSGNEPVKLDAWQIRTDVVRFVSNGQK
jgi:hypothetical protein